jgi:hypothetical protein
MIRALTATLVLLLISCSSEEVVLGERGVDSIDGSTADAAVIDASAPDAVADAVPDATPEVCLCCCPEGPGICPDVCACESNEDCPAEFECAIPEGEDTLFCIEIL